MGSNDARRVSSRRQGPRPARADAGPDPPARPDVGGAGDPLGGRRASTGIARQAFSSIGSLANELIDQIDRERIREVRARVDRKILEQSHPKHLSYELLHGIRSLTGYDHSAALLIYDDERGALEVVAEQIAWQKAKGQNVGPEAAAVAGAPRTASSALRLRLRSRRQGLAQLDGHRRDRPGRAARLRRARRAGRHPRREKGRSSAPRWRPAPGCWGSSRSRRSTPVRSASTRSS